MLGIVKTYDTETQTGVLNAGKESFDFAIADWVAEAPPESGDVVVFDLRGVKPYNINLQGAVLNRQDGVKRRLIAIPLALFLGVAGGHRLYLGYYRMALTQIVVNFLLWRAGLPGYAFLWGFVEAFLIYARHIDKDAQGRPLK